MNSELRNGKKSLGRLGRWLGVVAYCGVVTAGVGVWGARSVYAHVAESMMKQSAFVEQFGDLTGLEQSVHLNGERLQVSSAVVPGTVSEVLDRLESHCREGSAKAEDGNGKGVLSKLNEIGKGDYDGLRNEEGDRGVLMCFAPLDKEKRPSLMARLSKFAASGDLADIGAVRYATAKKLEGGRTHIVTVWTDGPLRLDKLLPREGDAPGADPEGAVRPTQSRRLLHGFVERSGFSLRVYQSKNGVDEALKAYDEGMAALGWLPNQGAQAALGTGRAYSRGDSDIVVVAEATEAGSRMSIVETKSKFTPRQ